MVSPSGSPVTPPSSQMAELFLLGPLLQDSQKQRGFAFACLLVGFDAARFSIVWKVNGAQRSGKQDPPSRKDNGTETVRSTLQAKKSDWRAGSRITCEAKHLCSDKAVERQLEKAQGQSLPFHSIRFNSALFVWRF